METIKRQSRRMRLAVGHRSACDRRLSLRPIGPTLALSVSWPAPLQLRYATWGAIQVLYVFAFAFAFGQLLSTSVMSNGVIGQPVNTYKKHVLKWRQKVAIQGIRTEKTFSVW